MMSRLSTCTADCGCCVNHKVVEYIRAVILAGIKNTSIILNDNVLPHIGNLPLIPGVSESESLEIIFSSSHSLNEVENTTVGPSIKPNKNKLSSSACSGIIISLCTVYMH